MTEQQDPAYVEELRRWVRDAATREDGLPASVVPVGGHPGDTGLSATTVSIRNVARQVEGTVGTPPTRPAPKPARRPWAAGLTEGSG